MKEAEKTPDMSLAVDNTYVEALYHEQLVHPDPISNFEGLTSPKNPRLAKMMGSLIGEVSPEQFSSFCQSFAKGVGYVRDKYGTQPAGIMIVDEADYPICADVEAHTILITRDFIKKPSLI